MASINVDKLFGNVSGNKMILIFNKSRPQRNENEVLPLTSRQNKKRDLENKLI